MRASVAPPKVKPSMKCGADGLTDRERAYGLERRKDPTSPNWIIAQRAGFLGDRGKLGERARMLMKKPAVLAIIHAPERPDEMPDEETLKRELQVFFRSVVRGTATPADKIRAADKLGQTLKGFYVPVGVDLHGQFTLEAAVRAMGGAPEETGRLPSHEDERDHKEDA